MTARKKFFLVAVVILILASAAFFILRNRQRELIINDCLVGLDQASDEELVEEFSKLTARIALQAEESDRLTDFFLRYLSNRLQISVNSPRETVYGLIDKLNVEESRKALLRKGLDERYEGRSVRHKLVFYDINYLCPGGRENLKIVEECVNFPAERGVASRFDTREVALACRNFCSDLTRYNRDPQLFFAEENEVKVLERYKIADVLKIFWSIRFGGWDFVLGEIEKISDPQDYEFMRDEIVKATVEDQQKESENMLNQFKRGLCEMKLK